MLEGNILISILGGGTIGILYFFFFIRQYIAPKGKNIVASMAFSLLRLGFLGVSVIFLVTYAKASLVLTSLSFVVTFWVYTLIYARNNA